jgi:hypothetical protein
LLFLIKFNYRLPCLTKDDKLTTEGHVAMKKLLEMWLTGASRRRMRRGSVKKTEWMREQLVRAGKMHQGIISGSIGR